MLTVTRRGCNSDQRKEFMEGRYTHAVVSVPRTLADTPAPTLILRPTSSPPLNFYLLEKMRLSQIDDSKDSGWGDNTAERKQESSCLCFLSLYLEFFSFLIFPNQQRSVTVYGQRSVTVYGRTPPTAHLSFNSLSCGDNRKLIFSNRHKLNLGLCLLRSGGLMENKIRQKKGRENE